MKPVQVKVTELMVELKSELSQVKEEIIAENLTSLSISTVVSHHRLHNVKIGIYITKLHVQAWDAILFNEDVY